MSKTVKITKLVPKGIDLDQNFKVDYKFLNGCFFLDATDLRISGLTLFDLCDKHGESNEFNFIFALSESLKLATVTIQAVCDVCNDESNNMDDCKYCEEMKQESRAIEETNRSLFISER